MKHTGKRILGLFLALALVFTLLPAVTLTAAADDTYKIYAIKNNSWSSVYVYWWGTSSDPTWPGVAMTSYCNGAVYGYDIPSDVSGILFTNGQSSSAEQTQDITSGIVDGASWTINDTMSYGKYTVSTTPTYYLVGTMNNWETNSNYAFSLNLEADGLEYKLSGVQLANTDKVKVCSSSNEWYPGGSNNDYEVGETGIYDVYFRPGKKTDSGWHYDYFYLARVGYSVSDGTNTTYYANAIDALSAWTDGTTLKLYKDISLSSGVIQVASGVTKTLDLNGHTFSTGSNPSVYIEGGSLTVNDTSASGTGKIYNAKYAVYNYSGSFTLNGGTIEGGVIGLAVGGTSTINGGKVISGGQAAVYNAGTLILNNGTIGSSTESIGIYSVGGTATLNGGSVLCGSGASNYAVYLKSASASVTVAGATVGSATANRGIYAYNANTVSITSGTVKAKGFAIVAYANTVVNISGGMVECCTAETEANKMESAVQISEGASCTISGTANIVSSGHGVYIGNYANPTAGDKTLTVSGGTINVTGMGIASNGTADENITINISGGTITGGETALFSPNRGETVNITGGTLEGGTGIVVKGGTVNISADAKIIGTGASVAPTTQGSGFTGTGDAILVEDSYGADYAPTVHITGGTFSSGNGYAMQYFTQQSAADAQGYIDVTSGSFESHQNTSEYNNSTLDDKIIISGGLYDGEPDVEDLAPGKVAVETSTPGKWTIGASNIQSCSLSLKGDIGINYYVELPAGHNAGDTEITFSWGTGVDAETKTFAFSDLTESGGLYKATVNVKAKQMSDKITATIKDGNTTLEASSYSVAQYANRVLENKNGEFTNSIANLDKLQELCKAMLIYGAKAQAEFDDYNIANPADKGLTYTLTAPDTNELPEYPVPDLTAFGLTFASSSLVLESKTTHRLYFTGTAEAGLKVKCGSTELEIVPYNEDGYSCYVDIPNMAAKNVLKNYTVRFSTDDFATSTPLKVNAKMYIKNALETDNDTLKAVVTALYDYSAAADIYFSAN